MIEVRLCQHEHEVESCFRCGRQDSFVMANWKPRPYGYHFPIVQPSERLHSGDFICRYCITEEETVQAELMLSLLGGPPT